MSVQDPNLDALQDIRKMMQRSRRFISLSGLSGVAAGIWALIGVYFASDLITKFGKNNSDDVYNSFPEIERLKMDLILLAGAVLILAVLSALFFTWRRAGRNKLPLWDYTSRQLMVNTAIPLVTGGLFILAMLRSGDWRFIAPASLVFYGLALVNGSKYTLTDIRYLGFLEIILGLINTQFPRSGLYFWAAGFGVLHIIYGFVMWWKYERNPTAEN